jgi:hypothetical protein
VVIRRAAVAVAFALVANAAFAAGIGDPAPAFALRDAQGDTLSLERLRGQVVYWSESWQRAWRNQCRRRPWNRSVRPIAWSH